MITRATEGADSSDCCPGVWNVFHDATVLAASGEIGQEVVLRLECDYLRERFAGPAGAFVLTLHACSRFEFEPSDNSEKTVTDIESIGGLRLWILRAEPVVDHCQVHCNRHVHGALGGVLRVAARSFEVRLDSGRVIPMAEIKQAATEYWEEFESSTRKEI